MGNFFKSFPKKTKPRKNRGLVPIINIMKFLITAARISHIKIRQSLPWCFRFLLLPLLPQLLCCIR